MQVTVKASHWPLDSDNLMNDVSLNMAIITANIKTVILKSVVTFKVPIFISSVVIFVSNARFLYKIMEAANIHPPVNAIDIISFFTLIAVSIEIKDKSKMRPRFFSACINKAFS